MLKTSLKTFGRVSSVNPNYKGFILSSESLGITGHGMVISDS